MNRLNLATSAIVALAFFGSEAGARDINTWNTTAEIVKGACGKKLQSSGGSFGCTICNPTIHGGGDPGCYDLSCGDGTHGTKKGCVGINYRAFPNNNDKGGQLTHKGAAP